MLKDNDDTEPTEVDQLVLATLVPPDHDLRRVKQLLDVERFRERVKDGYSPALGRTAEDPVRVIKLAFLPFHDRLSDREVIAAAQVNVAFRFFLEVSLESRLPVPSLLSQVRTRLGEPRHQALLDAVVAQAREHGLGHDRLRLQEATHSIAKIASPSTMGLVAQTRDRLLARARPSAPDRVAQAAAAAAQIRLVTSDLTDTARLCARVAHLRAIVAWAEAWQQTLGPRPERADRQRQRFEDALALAHQVLADRDHPDQGDQGRRSVDPDARRGRHGDDFDGYVLAVSVDADSEVLTALHVLPGTGDEGRDAPVLWAAEAQAQGHVVQALSMDGMGWPGEVVRPLSDPQGLGVEVYVPPPPRQQGPDCRPEQFTLDARGEVLTCPGGQQTTAKARNAHNTGWQFTFAQRLCAGCALLARGLAAWPQHQGRSVIKNDDQVEDDAARDRAQTARYAEVRRQQPRVARKLADIVRDHGGRRSRYRGQWRVQMQYLLIGVGVKIKRIVKRLGPQGGRPLLQAG